MKEHDNERTGVPLPLAAVLAGGAVLIGTVGFFSPMSSEEPPEPTRADAVETASPSAPPARTGMTASVRGVNAEVAEVTRSAGMTRVTVRMDNHVHDLSDPAARSRTSLAGAEPASYEVSGSGHHVTLRLSFEGEQEGTLVLEPVEGIGFSFEI